MTTRAQIVTEAREWIGTRWQHQAAVKGVACDCIGLVYGVAARSGIDEAAAFSVSTERVYGRLPDPQRLLGAADHFLDRIAIDAARMGDLYVMRFGTEPQHFAMLSGTFPHRIIHAYAQMRKVVEHGLDAKWKSRITHAFRFRGLTD